MLFVQAMNILIVNQSIIDMCTSFVMLLTAVVEVDGTRMSRDSFYDQFVCRIWLTRLPLWALMVTSTYGIIMIAFERYFAVIYPVWYNVRMKSLLVQSNSHFNFSRVIFQIFVVACCSDTLNALWSKNYIIAITL